MKIIWEFLTYGAIGLGGLVALSVAISAFSPESPTGESERVRLDAVRNAVDHTLTCSGSQTGSPMLANGAILGSH
jgi:hypothetical protein